MIKDFLRRRRFILIFGLFTFLVATIFASSSPPESKGTSMDPYNAPDFKLTTLQGESVSLSDYKGDVIFVNFWATWCGPCRKEIPDFITLQNEYSDSFQIIGVSVDDTQERVQEFYEENGLNYIVGMTSPEIEEKFGPIRGIPATFIINKDFQVVEKIVGLRSYDEFKAKITSLL